MVRSWMNGVLTCSCRAKSRARIPRSDIALEDWPLRPGDVIRIEGTPDGAERAPLDYIEVLPLEH